MQQQKQQQQAKTMFQRGPAPKMVPIFKIFNNDYNQLRSKYPAASPRQFNNLNILEIAAKNEKVKMSIMIIMIIKIYKT